MNTDTTDRRALERRLLSAVSAYDRRREGRRGHNPYALPLYLQGVDDVMDLMSKGATLRAALEEVFNDRLLDACLKAVGEAPHV